MSESSFRIFEKILVHEIWFLECLLKFVDVTHWT